MNRFLEIILGLDKGFLSRAGSLAWHFNPNWPLGATAAWNLLLIVFAVAITVRAYLHEGHSRTWRIVLGTFRLAILALVICLLNRPTLTLGNRRAEPSVLGVLIDDSASMRVKDVVVADGKNESRLDGVIDLLTGKDAEFLRKMSREHIIHIYHFNRGRQELATVPLDEPAKGKRQQSDARPSASLDSAVEAVKALQPIGDATQVVASVRSVLQDMQGQRLAGIVVLTDGRETPTQAMSDAITDVKSYGVGIYPVAVGSEKPPQNIAVQTVSYEPSAFVDDLTTFRVSVRATGYEPNHQVELKLLRETRDASGQVHRTQVTDETGRPVSKMIRVQSDQPTEAELQFKPAATDIPVVNLVVEATPQDGEVDDSGNDRKVQLSVLDTNISVLFVDGYPRWDFRYLKNTLLRDKTVKVSCLLTSADPTFRQEGSDDLDRPSHSWAITAFPTAMEQLLDYDVVIFGDVDPRQFTDFQLQMVSDFVSKKGGGFAMVSGQRFSPQSFRNTPVEPVLPVIISRCEADESTSAITKGYRPALTRAGTESSIFRFFPDKTLNDEYIRNQLQELFWYCHGAVVKPGAGIVLAEHPTDLGTDGHKAPLLVTGRFGAGRTIWSAMDDSWRWRFYTGESVFDTYWVQQLRYLARSRKLGERKFSFTQDAAVYELGKQATLTLRVMSPEILPQLSSPLNVEVIEDATGQVVGRVSLTPSEVAPDVFSGSFTTDKSGQFTARLPKIGNDQAAVSYRVEVPQLELSQPEVDMAGLSRLATEGVLTLPQAAEKLPVMIHSAARTIIEETSRPLWDAPLAIALFGLLITLEWVARKMQGLL